MIGRAIEVKPICNNVCDKAKFNTNGMRLRKYMLADAEWLIMEQLHPLLDVSLFVSLYSDLECVI